MDECNTIYHERTQTLGKCSVAGDFAFRIVFKVSITLEATFHKLAELGCKGVEVVQMMHTKTRT